MGGVAAIEPPRETRQMVAVDPTVPGGSFGVGGLNNNYIVALVDEAADGRDYDGRPGDSVLVSWIEPRDPDDDDWHFSHQAENRTHGTAIFGDDGSSEPYATALWMADEELEGRLGIAFDESVPGANASVGSRNNNVDCREILKDTDVVDALPVWMDFEAGPTLDFDGVGFATLRDNTGLVVSQAFAYFRVSELEDNRDWNEDGDLDDLVLARNPIISCDPEIIDVTVPFVGPSIFAVDFAQSACFFSTGIDFDGDGNANELVVRHFDY